MKKKKIMKIKENRKKEKKNHERIKGNERKKEAKAKN